MDRSGAIGRVLLPEGAVVHTFDWQTAYNFNKDVTGTFGILTCSTRIRRFDCKTGGGGNQIGYDGRYADPIGRAFYGRIGVKF